MKSQICYPINLNLIKFIKIKIYDIENCKKLIINIIEKIILETLECLNLRFDIFKEDVYYMDLSYLVKNSFIRLLDVQNELDKIILDFYEKKLNF